MIALKSSNDFAWPWADMSGAESGDSPPSTLASILHLKPFEKSSTIAKT